MTDLDDLEIRAMLAQSEIDCPPRRIQTRAESDEAFLRDWEKWNDKKRLQIPVAPYTSMTVSFIAMVLVFIGVACGVVLGLRMYFGR